MSPKALPARRLLFQPSHPPPIVVQVETLLARFVYNLIKIVYNLVKIVKNLVKIVNNLTELGFIIILWVIPGCQASFGKVADTLKISQAQAI